MSKVFFHSADRTLNLKDKTVIKSFIEKIFSLEKKPLERIDYIFCSDDYLIDMNQHHLNHNFYTDILTFELSATKFTKAEVYISLDRVKDNAKNLHQPLIKETLRVLFHGALHLCGYKDKSTKEAILMREMEEKYIQTYQKIK
ncbi:MAG TPA: rRNA maturation RNase YbeY [Arachidicoccus sp.]|nr:rRNA maturation RNase YbeY [Arachidicoccus sp.]